MKYKIEISQILTQDSAGQKYPTYNSIFQQVIDGDERTVLDIIKATNGLMFPPIFNAGDDIIK